MEQLRQLMILLLRRSDCPVLFTDTTIQVMLFLIDWMGVNGKREPLWPHEVPGLQWVRGKGDALLCPGADTLLHTDPAFEQDKGFKVLNVFRVTKKAIVSEDAAITEHLNCLMHLLNTHSWDLVLSAIWQLPLFTETTAGEVLDIRKYVDRDELV